MLRIVGCLDDGGGQCWLAMPVDDCLHEAEDPLDAQGREPTQQSVLLLYNFMHMLQVLIYESLRQGQLRLDSLNLLV